MSYIRSHAAAVMNKKNNLKSLKLTQVVATDLKIT